jgi:hypothetical protein
VPVPANQETNKAIAETAHAVVKHDGSCHRQRTANTMRGKSNLPATVSMMLIWQV